MNPFRLLSALVIATLSAIQLTSWAAKSEVGPFFEPDFPFCQIPVNLGNGQPKGNQTPNFVVRGVILPLEQKYCVVFDQELLRFAGLWTIPDGRPPVTLKTMAQVSYSEPHRKSGSDHPRPTGNVLLSTPMHPGVATRMEALLADPRKSGPVGELGRGPLPADVARFEGIELMGATAVLNYRCGGTMIREWFESGGTVVYRHFEVEPHQEPLFFSLGSVGAAQWSMEGRHATAQGANGQTMLIATSSDVLTLHREQSEIIGELAPTSTKQKVSVAMALNAEATPSFAEGFQARASAGLPASAALSQRRWPEIIPGGSALDSVTGNGLTLDRLDLPLNNPWKRRVRPADIAFLSASRAAVVTYDGDVWLVDGVDDPALVALKWKRFASGLHEPLALAAVGGVIQVATKNGLVRLHDRDRNDEADWYENFSDLILQSQGTRSFPLDMDIGPDGSTYVSQGGIPMGGTGTVHSGAIARVSPNGRAIELFASRAREPYVTVHPKKGIVTGSDQQGQYIPSSVSYLIRKGDSFGFGEEKPEKLTPPLVWIPHLEDSSSASELWLLGDGMGPLQEKLLHLSYGNGRIFLISPDLEAPVPQGAVIPLGFETNIPLLQGAMHPGGASAFLCGFQIYDSRTKDDWAIGRLRLSGSPITTAVEAMSCSDGVVLSFTSPIKPESVTQERVSAAAWNYKRSSQYGSGRYKLSGEEGTDVLGIGQVVLSTDRQSAFVHLPGLTSAMQVEVRHDFELANGARAQGVVYFTVHQPRALDLVKAGFPEIDLTKSVVLVRQQNEEPASLEVGKTLSQTMGCVACHSTDGTNEGKTGPTWKGLFGIDRKFTDGSIESANEFYLRDSILDPQRKVVAGYQPGMASYRGLLTDKQIDSLIMYIRSLK